MARAPYTFVRPGGVTHPIFHIGDLGRRIVALAEGRGVHLEVHDGPHGLDCLRITAVPLAGAPELLGQVLRPNTSDLRNRVALAIALAQSDRAELRLRKAA